ncbi:MAG: hypothetical protein FWH55_12815 [Oscillospiraceae bacterium]|nr:hypothetical protein [Oscillospiraceae bacterium]
MNRNLFSMVLPSFCFVLASWQTNAGEVPFPQCPQELNIKQEIQSPVGDGWEKAASIANLHLRGHYFTYGDYSDKQTGPLRATEEKKLSNGDVMIFYDSLGDGQPDNYVHWATCFYENSAVQLTQKLPENIVRCEVKHRNDVLAPDRITVKCFDTPRTTK